MAKRYDAIIIGGAANPPATVLQTNLVIGEPQQSNSDIEDGRVSG